MLICIYAHVYVCTLIYVYKSKGIKNGEKGREEGEEERERLRNRLLLGS